MINGAENCVVNKRNKNKISVTEIYIGMMNPGKERK